MASTSGMSLRDARDPSVSPVFALFMSTTRGPTKPPRRQESSRAVRRFTGNRLPPRPLLPGSHGPTTPKEAEGIDMTHDTHTTTPTAEPAAGGPMPHETVDRELLAARTELASLGATASPSRLERALERLEAAQRASRQPFSRAA